MDANRTKPERTEKYVISKRLDGILLDLNHVAKFVGRFFQQVFLPPYEFKEVLRQCYEVGYKSLPLISLTGFITGIVFTNQSRPSLAEFGATSWSRTRTEPESCFNSPIIIFIKTDLPVPERPSTTRFSPWYKSRSAP